MIVFVLTSLRIAFQFISDKLNTANIYKNGAVPEVVTHITGIEQDFVQLSSLDIATKSCMPHSIIANVFHVFHGVQLL